MDFSVIDWPLFGRGLITTAYLVGASLLIGLVMAHGLAVGVVYGPRYVAWPIRAYTYFMRGTPMLVQLYLLYYGASQFTAIRDSSLWVILREAYWCALIAFSLNTAAYTAVILQGAMQSVDRGEIEAARACGFSEMGILCRIVLPSAWRRALPSYGNEVIFMLHGSSIAGVVTLLDVTGVARQLYAATYRPFEPFIVAGGLYLLLTLGLVLLFRLLEWRFTRHLHRPS